MSEPKHINYQTYVPAVDAEGKTFHCVYGPTTENFAPCYGAVHPMHHSWLGEVQVVQHLCEGHLNGDGADYVPESAQEGADVGQETFLSPQEELAVLRVKLATLSAENASHIAARGVQTHAINRLAGELATLRADAEVKPAPKQESDPVLVQSPAVHATDLSTVACRHHEVQQCGIGYLQGKSLDAYHLRIALLNLKDAVDAVVFRVVKGTTKFKVDCKAGGDYWLHMDVEMLKASINLGHGHPQFVTGVLDAAVRQTAR